MISMGKVIAVSATSIPGMVMIVKARQTGPDASTDIVPHLMSIHRVAAARKTSCPNGAAGEAIVARPARTATAPVRDVRRALLSLMPARKIPTLPAPTHTVCGMLSPHAAAAGRSGVATGKAVRGASPAAGDVPT